MEDIQEGFPTDFRMEEAAFQKVMESHSDVSTSLPPWQSEADRLSQYFQSLQKMVENFIDRYLRPEKKVDLSWIRWDMVLMVLAGVIILALVVLLVYLIMDILKGRSQDLKYRIIENSPSLKTRESILIEQIQSMMAQGDWSKAAKLRWRLFLERKRLAGEITPLEFEQDQSADLPEAMEQYRNMFIEPKGSSTWYRSYSDRLRKLEESQ